MFSSVLSVCVYVYLWMCLYLFGSNVSANVFLSMRPFNAWCMYTVRSEVSSTRKRGGGEG